MNIDKLIEKAETNLRTHLEWVGRYDTKISFVTVISIGMLGVMIDKISSSEDLNIYTSLILVATTLLLLLSLLFIYLGQYPHIESKNNSIIFFKTISEMKVDEFIKQFKNTSDEDYLNDTLFQVHINAELLTKKFIFFKRSLVFLLLSIIPWVILLYVLK